MRKDIYEGVQVYVNQNIKPNYAALARQYKADYRTVKHAYEKAKQVNDNLSEVKQKTIRQSKLDPFKQLIEEKLLLVSAKLN